MTQTASMNCTAGYELPIPETKIIIVCVNTMYIRPREVHTSGSIVVGTEKRIVKLRGDICGGTGGERGYCGRLDAEKNLLDARRAKKKLEIRDICFARSFP